MDEYKNFSINRSSIILFTSTCTSLPALVWVIHFCCQNRTRKFKTVLLIPVLFNDVLQVLSSVTWLLLTGPWNVPCDDIFTSCVVIDKLWSMSRVCGLFLHVSLALEKVLYVVYPDNANRRCFLVWALPFSFVVLITVIAVQFKGLEAVSYAHVHSIHIFYLDFSLYLVALVLAGVLSLVAFPNLLTTPKYVREETSNVLRVTVATLLLYFPQFMLLTMHFAKSYAAGYALDLQVSKSIANLRLLTDAALCWLVCRERGEEDQRHTNSNRSRMCEKHSGTRIERDQEESETVYDIIN